MVLLKNTLKQIKPSCDDTKNRIRKKWDGLAKPIGSLGSLEEITIKIGGMTGQVKNKIRKKAIVVIASDNGIIRDGVSASPQHFTKVLAENMSKGITGVATLGKHYGCDIITVDLGIIGEVQDPNIIDKKIREGTSNFTKGPAMSYEEAVKAIEIGIEIGDNLYRKGYDIIGTGEVGIGNTTTSAAMVSVLADLEVESICGKGAGLRQDQFECKKQKIIDGISVNKPNREDPIDVLAKVGGFDIGGICGLFLSAAKNRKPALIDGFISSVAALVAVRLNPLVKNFLLPSHLSAEPGAKYVMKELKLKPMLNLGMRLGEGSGCPLAIGIIEAGLYSLENMATFDQVSLSSESLVDIREDKQG